MKQQILVVGAGDIGGYLAWNLDQFDLPYEVHGFLDDDPEKEGRILYSKPVLGPVERMEQYAGWPVVVGIAVPAYRRRVVDFVSQYTDQFPSIVPPHVWISEGVDIGRGVILYPGVSVNFETSIGDFSIINMNAAIGHNCTIEPFCTLSPGVNLGGFSHLESGVTIGIGASTRQRVRIGAHAVVGGKGMVVTDVPSETTVVGVPARVLSNNVN